jgi:hypothetical protein
MRIAGSFRHGLISALVVCSAALGLALRVGSADAASLSEAPSGKGVRENGQVSKQARTAFRWLIVQGATQYHLGGKTVARSVIKSVISKPLSKVRSWKSIFGPQGLGRLISECLKPEDRANWAKTTYGKFDNAFTDKILRATGDGHRVREKLEEAGMLKRGANETVTDWDHADAALTNAFSMIVHEYKKLGGSIP